MNDLTTGDESKSHYEIWATPDGYWWSRPVHNGVAYLRADLHKSRMEELIGYCDEEIGNRDARIAELEAEIAGIVSDLNSEVSDNRSREAKYKERIVELEFKLDCATKRQDMIDKKLRDSAREANVPFVGDNILDIPSWFVGMLNESEQRIKKLEEAIQDLRGQLRATSETRDDYYERIAELEAALTEWQTSHKSQVDATLRARKRIAELEAENRHLKAVEYETRSESTSEWVDG